MKLLNHGWKNQNKKIAVNNFYYNFVLIKYYKNVIYIIIIYLFILLNIEYENIFSILLINLNNLINLFYFSLERNEGAKFYSIMNQYTTINKGSYQVNIFKDFKK